MELKNYQKRVMANLASYLDYLNSNSIESAWNKYWEAHDIGVGFGGVPNYKNAIDDVPHICFKVPTGGGKTFMACTSLKIIFDKMPKEKPKVVVWLAPSDPIMEQTIRTLTNVNHPYRQQMDKDFAGRVEVFTKDQLLNGQNFSPDTVKEMLTVCVLSYDSLRIDSTKREIRKVFQENGNLRRFADYYKSNDVLLADTDETALIQVLRHLEPVVVVDESHNASSDYSIEMLNNLNPSFVLDLTATPKTNSNIISYVDARELKKENMVKLPVVIYNRDTVKDVISDAIKLRGSIEQQAKIEYENGGEYIRPIVLFQAQPRTKADTITFEKIKEKLINIGIPENEIAIKTSAVNDIKGIDLLSKDCPIRYIITVDALKEGWDCPFAYILASVANKTSRVAVEQILGRILRQPYAKKHNAPLLNTSYVLTSSNDFKTTLDDIVIGLNKAGFSRKDYRIGELPKQPEPIDEVEQLTVETPVAETENQQSETDNELQWIDTEIPDDFHMDVATTMVEVDERVAEMTTQAETETQEYNEELQDSSNDGFFGGELGDMLNQFPIQEKYKAEIENLRIPQFFLNNGEANLFNEGFTLLEKENLTEGFSLNKIPADIDFELATGDMFQIDISQEGEAIPKYRRVNKDFNEEMRKYLESMATETRIKQCADEIAKEINKNNLYSTKDVSEYVARVISEMSDDALRSMETAIPLYARKIEKHIKIYEREYRKKQFEFFVEMNRIECKDNYMFPPIITPNENSNNLDKSLYTAERNDLNIFEFKLISEVVSLDNVVWWHRIIDRKGFRINGFINHYPDFVVKTKKGNIVMIEAKGEHLANDDSKDKVRLGKKWDELSGKNFKYYMVFKDKDFNLPGSYNLDKFISILKEL